MKILVLALLFCTGIYFATKTPLKPTTIEVGNNSGKQSCTAPNTLSNHSNHHKNCCIIMDRASVILKQNNKHSVQD